MYDVVFLSYKEKNADENWQRLKSMCPWAIRVHGVEGIFNAHKQAAISAFTTMFYVVDGDAYIVDGFTFNFKPNKQHRKYTHIWRCKNAVNDLVYGYGGVKLFPRKEILQRDSMSTDFTTSLNNGLVIVNELSNETRFNTSEFEAWKSAFRECVKLSSKVIDRQKDDETLERLDIWCSKGVDKPFGRYCIDGAKAGREFGLKNKDNVEELSRINDFNWLNTMFNKYYEKE